MMALSQGSRMLGPRSSKLGKVAPAMSLEVHFTLTADDLRDGLRVLQRARVQRWGHSWVVFALSGVLACWLTWLVVSFLIEPLIGPLWARVAYGVAVLVAVPLMTVRWRARRRRPAREVRRVSAWALDRQVAAALPRSVLGPMVLRVEDTGLWRRNERDERSFSPREVVRLLRGPHGVVVELENRKVLIVPTRAFEPSPGAQPFLEALARVTQRPVVEVLVGTQPA
jgi:hypothetical protein